MIIGISGLAGTGKDTTADFFVKNKNYRFVKVSLADILKRICKEVFDFSYEQLWGPSEKRNEPDERYYRYTVSVNGRQSEETIDEPPIICPQYLTARHALQELGTEWGRACYENVWIEYTLRIADKLSKNNPPIMYSSESGIVADHNIYDRMPPGYDVVIPDVRFLNEVNAIHHAGGKVIRIKRPMAGLSGQAGQHASEAGQLSIPDDSFDLIIDNNGTLRVLEIKSNLALLDLMK